MRNGKHAKSKQHRPPAGSRVVSARVRARQLRRRLRRAHQRQAQPQDHRGRGPPVVPHGPPRRARRRAEHRRRRRAWSRRCRSSSCESRQGSVRGDAAGPRQVRCRPRVPADGRRPSASAARRPSRRLCAEEGQVLVGWRVVPTDADAADLGDGARAAAPHIEQLFVAAGDRLRGRGVRAQAVSDPQAREPPAARRRDARAGEAVLCLQPVDQGAHLQGHADAGPAAELLSGSARRGLHDASGDGALALLDEHVPELGPRAAEPLHVAQRRDQHAARQRELDARAARRRRKRLVRRRSEEAIPDRGARLLGLGRVRQRARVPADDGPLAAGIRDDDDSRGMAEERAHAREQARVLRVPLVPHGAVGRPRVDRVHRRQVHRRRARPQRLAAEPLLPDA